MCLFTLVHNCITQCSKHAIAINNYSKTTCIDIHPEYAVRRKCLHSIQPTNLPPRSYSLRSTKMRIGRLPPLAFLAYCLLATAYCPLGHGCRR